jgi:hypothetical protein
VGNDWKEKRVKMEVHSTRTSEPARRCSDKTGCVGLQRRLGQTQRAELATLRRGLFSCAAVFTHAARKPTLKLSAATQKRRQWWRVLLRQLGTEEDCHAVAALAARASPNL